MAYAERPLHLPGRSVDMPVMYEAQNHPSLDTIPSYSRRKVYVGYMKTDPPSMKDYLTFEKKLKCPEGTIAEWKKQGLLEMEPGDYMFLRDNQHYGKELVSIGLTEDALSVMVSGDFHHAQHELDDFERATQNMLGPRNERTPDSTAFEATGCAKKIRKKRCYSTGLAIQQSRRVVAPTASLDQDKPNIEEYQEMTGDLIDSSAAMLLNVQELLPEECLNAFKANAELTGQPSVGVLGVHGTSSVQVNISAAGLEAGDTRLGDQLGDFGCEHFDRNDSLDHFTTMFSNPDVPAGYLPGAFHILQLGVFVILRKFVGVTFSGRRRHVGTAPTPPPGILRVPHAYRFNVVWYPKEAAVDGKSRWTLASLPGKSPSTTVQQDIVGKKVAGNDVSVEDSDGSESETLEGDVEQETKQKKKPEDPEPLYLTPEMINVDNGLAVARTTNRATFARSGHIIMDRQSHMNFMGRSLYLLTAYVWRQLPTEYGIRVDVDKLLGAVTYTQEGDGPGRVPLLPWASAPNIDGVSEDREENQKIWSAYQAKVRRFIPHFAGKSVGSGPAKASLANPSNSARDGSYRSEPETEILETEYDFDHQGTPQPPSRGARVKGKQLRGTRKTSNGEGERGGSTAKNGGKRGKSRKDKGREGPGKVGGMEGAAKRKGKGKGRMVENEEEMGGGGQMDVNLAERGQADRDKSKASSSKRERSGSLPSSSAKRPRLVALPQDFPFINGLTMNAMRRELEEIKNELALASAYPVHGTPSTFHLPNVLSASSSLVVDPVSSLAPSHVRGLLAQARIGVQSEIAWAIDARLRRYSILLSNVRIWYWLDVTIQNSIQEVFGASETREAGWLSAMVIVAKTCLEGKTRSLITFNPEDYPALLALRSTSITVPNPYRQLFTQSTKDQGDLFRAVVQIIRAALIEALDFPQTTSMMDRRRAWLLGTLADAIGTSFLATRYAWNSWTSFVVKDYFPWERMYKDDPNLILPFRQALRSHPICQDNSALRVIFLDFCQTFQHMMPSAPQPTSSPTQKTGKLASSNQQLEANLPSLISFLRASLEFVDGILPAQHPIYQHLSQNPDYYLPYREKAPSKVRFNGRYGPFRDGTIQLTSGLFSALVFRGITYNSPYSRHPDARMAYAGVEDFEVAVEIFKEQHPDSTQIKHFFCNPNAYSRQPITGRTLSSEILRSFWGKAAALDWAIRTRDILSFAECLRILIDANFPTMGSLQLFLLTGDLHYAGICSPPELSDVVDFMFRRKPKGGSLKALASLGFIPNPQTASRQEIEFGLRALDSHLHMAFTAEERSRMGLDLICLEHLLCKYGRALKQGVLQ